jgi:DegV family protein with EDD domain
MRRRTVPSVAIVTDSASDLPPDVAARDGITVVPLEVSFGPESFRPGVNMTTDEFWARMTAPDAQFPTTAAAAPGDFKNAYEDAFRAGADAVVCVTVSGDLSGTLKAAQVGAQQLEGRDIRVIDSRTASMGHGMLAQMGAQMGRDGASADEIESTIEATKARVKLYIGLDTLEYLKRGGRISGARAAVGTMLSIKPIITVENGIVENADRVRTRAKARERVLELLTEQPLEQASILHTTHADVEEFTARFQERSGLPSDRIQVMVVGPSVGPHLGPGCVGAVIITRA